MSKFFELAQSDLKYAKYGLDTFVSGSELNIAAYHLCQALEKILKGYLELEGKDMSLKYYRTHNIDVLIENLKDESIFPKNLNDYLDDFSQWVSKPRYDFELCIPKRKIKDVYNILNDWLGDILLGIQAEKIDIDR